MGLVALKCPRCNGDIQMDDGREFGFCMFCGTKIMNDRSACGEYTINHESEIVNFLKLAKIEALAENYPEAAKLCNDALRLDAEASDAWHILSCAGEERRREEYAGHAQSSSKSYGIFSASDVGSVRGYRAEFFFRNTFLTEVHVTLEIDGRHRVELERTGWGRYSAEVNLRNGRHSVRSVIRVRNGKSFRELKGECEIDVRGGGSWTLAKRLFKGWVLVPAD